MKRGLFVSGHILAVVLSSLSYGTLLAQDDTMKVLVTVDDQSVIQASPSSHFDSLLQQYAVFDVHQAFPASRKSELLNVYELSCVCNQSDLITALSTTPGVSQPEPAFKPQLLYMPDDYNLVFNPDYALDLINAPGAWQITQGDTSVMIGISDMNYDMAHEELSGNKVAAGGVTGSYPTNHGTAVAITAAGNTNNGVGKSSIGHDCSLGLFFMTYNDLLLARNMGARIVNVSWHDGWCSVNSYNQQVINELYEDGVIVIAAAGNGAVTCGDSTAFAYPASYEHVISVTGVGPNNNIERYPTNPTTLQYNDSVDLTAPGWDVPLSTNGNYYMTSSGTSFAAPFVAGTVGLMLSVNPCLTVDQVEEILKATAVDIDSINPAYAGKIGSGRIDAAAAVAMAKSYLPHVLAQNCFDGSATVDASMLEGPASYMWSSGQSGATATGLSTGSYTVVITDAATGCTVTDTVELVDPITANFIVTPSCTYDEGQIEAVVSGPTGPYSYSWNTGDTTAVLNNTPPGTYALQIGDAQGCFSTHIVQQSTVVNTADFDYPSGLTITSSAQAITDLNGDGVIRIRGVLTFDDDVAYTLENSHIEFARDTLPKSEDAGISHSGIIIREGSHFIARACTFSSVSMCDAMWEGLQVWGRTNLQQGDGKLELRNSEVRNADIGVACYRTSLPYHPQNPDYGKGYLLAKGTTFKNNAVAIAFSGKVLTSNNSRIIGCSFISDSLLKDQSRYPGRGSLYFIRLSHVSGPRIEANSFLGDATLDPDQRTSGIVSYNSAYSVTAGYPQPVAYGSAPVKNSFFQLFKGIDIYSNGGATVNVKVEGNLFSAVQQGITANNSHFDEIVNNTFVIPAGSSALHTWGINMYNCSGFLTAENELNTSSSSTYTYGIIARNSNATGSRLYRNHFSGNFFAATQLEQNNASLQLQCNKYDGANTHDWAITSGALQNQGGCLNNLSGANNYFNDCAGGSPNQIFMATGSPNFMYYSAWSLLPDCSSPAIVTTACSYAPDFSADCPEMESSGCLNCGHPLKSLIAEYTEARDDVERSVLKTQLIAGMVYEQAYDSLFAFLSQEGSAADLRMLAATYLDLGMYKPAFETVSMAREKYPDAAREFGLYSLLASVYENGEGKQGVSEEFKEMSARGSVFSECVLSDFGQAQIVRFAESIDLHDEYRTDESVRAMELRAYPNPSAGNVNLVYHFESGQEITLYNALGQVAQQIEIAENSELIRLSELPPGMFLVCITQAGQLIDQQKIAIIR